MWPACRRARHRGGLRHGLGGLVGSDRAKSPDSARIHTALDLPASPIVSVSTAMGALPSAATGPVSVEIGTAGITLSDGSFAPFDIAWLAPAPSGVNPRPGFFGPSSSHAPLTCRRAAARSGRWSQGAYHVRPRRIPRNPCGPSGRDRGGGACQARAADRVGAGRWVPVKGADRPVLNLCANNYLGLADHPALIAAAGRRWTTTAMAWPRSASSAARRTCTASWRRGWPVPRDGRCDPLRRLLRCEWRAVRAAAGARGRDHLGRAEPRLDHRRHPALQGATLPLRQFRHGRSRRAAEAGPRRRGAASS